MIKVFLGFDHRAPVLHAVLSHSIHKFASRPVAIAPVMLSQLNGIFERDRNPLQSTAFSFSRFLVPYLCNYEGWAIFLDNDMVCLDDIAKLWELRDEQYAVMCAQHDYEVKTGLKFLGEKQTSYEKKNWSSMLLLNCSRCRALTPDFVNSASGLDLHQFKWLPTESLIGELPIRWNYLVGVYPPQDDVSMVHYTDGGPYYTDYRHVDFAEKWFDLYEDMKRV